MGVRAACEVLGAAQAGYYRRHRQSPAALSGALPAWCLLILIGVPILLTTVHVVTQIIRLRASAKISRSQDAVRVPGDRRPPPPSPSEVPRMVSV